MQIIILSHSKAVYHTYWHHSPWQYSNFLYYIHSVSDSGLRAYTQIYSNLENFITQQGYDSIVKYHSTYLYCNWKYFYVFTFICSLSLWNELITFILKLLFCGHHISIFKNKFLYYSEISLHLQLLSQSVPDFIHEQIHITFISHTHSSYIDIDSRTSST